MTEIASERLRAGRVVNVRPRPDGTYAVTLVEGRRGTDFLWVLAADPPRLGAFLTFEAAATRRFGAFGGRSASITIVEGGKVNVVADKWSRRYVPAAWLAACQRAALRPLYAHQLEGAGWVAERLAAGKGAILADDPGLGKTQQVAVALLVARALPAIVVCPASLKLNWQRELGHLAVPLSTVVVEGIRGGIDPGHIIITNYDLLREREQQFARLGAKAIVFDEGHMLKEPTTSESHRAAVATRLAKAIGRAIVMTGTPLPNRPRELWRLLHLADPEEWPSYEQFYERYCLEPTAEELLPGRKVVTDYGRVHNLDELQVRMAPAMLRRLKAHVLSSLPPKRRRRVLVELTGIDRQNYNAAAHDVVAWLKSLGSHERAKAASEGEVLVKLQMLRRIAAIGKLRHAVPRYLRAWFEAGAARPLVVFGFHTRVLRGVKMICWRLGLKVASIAGTDPHDKRQQALDAFANGEAQVFVAAIRAAGQGVNLQRAADALFIERLWEPWAMQQAEDRLHRLGQTSEVVITYLDASDTVDEHIARVLSTKQLLIDAVVDDRRAPRPEQLEREALEQVISAMRDQPLCAPTAAAGVGLGASAAPDEHVTAAPV